jgi:hypothetical protein
MLSQETDHVSPTEVTPELGKGALGTWWPTRPYGGRLDKTGTYAGYGSGGEAVGKPGVAGVYTNQRLKPLQDLGRPTDDRPRLQTGLGKSDRPAL